MFGTKIYVPSLPTWTILSSHSLALDFREMPVRLIYWLRNLQATENTVCPIKINKIINSLIPCKNLSLGFFFFVYLGSVSQWLALLKPEEISFPAYIALEFHSIINATSGIFKTADVSWACWTKREKVIWKYIQYRNKTFPCQRQLKVYHTKPLFWDKKSYVILKGIVSFRS